MCESASVAEYKNTCTTTYVWVTSNKYCKGKEEGDLFVCVWGKKRPGQSGERRMSKERKEGAGRRGVL